MKYNFVEIGTSNFDALIQSATDTTIGLSIEPIQYYLDCLPDRAGVKKLKCAVAPRDVEEILEIFYVPESVIDEQNLPQWLKGCNRVGAYHRQHLLLQVEKFVVRDPVLCVPIGKIFDQEQVTELDYLKIDTEGLDCNILLQLFVYLSNKDTTRYPKKISFESNELAIPGQVELVKNKFISLGYTVIHAGFDTVLEFI